MTEQLMLVIALIGILGSIAQWLAWWLKLPSILLLLTIGIILGQSFIGVINPDQLFGNLLFPFVSLAVSVILFEGALTLKFHEIKGLESVVRKMVTVGMLVTWLTVGIASHYLLELSWSLALLFGSLVVVTGPTVIVPMLRTLKLNSKLANVLRWEGIVIDPLGALLAVLVFQFIMASHQGNAEWVVVIKAFFWILFIGSFFGALAGAFLALILRRHWLPEYLHNVFVLTLVFATFATTNALAHESGLLAVTVMGMWLANCKNTPIEDILHFKESLTILLISGLFIILAARADLTQLLQLGGSAIALFFVVQFVARPLKILVSTWGSDFNWKEKIALSWIAPRGIIAAAISALFALRLEQEGVQQASLLVSLTFMIIIGTVVFQSVTARVLTVKLGVANPESKGIFIIGSNPVAIQFAEALNKQGFEAVVSDSHWRYIREARMKGIRTYYGNPVSEHADHHLDLVGVGKMLGLSMNNDLNLLAANRYKSEFGIANTFILNKEEKNKNSDKHSASKQGKALILFDQGMTYQKLASQLANEWQIKTTNLTENYLLKDLTNDQPEAVLLFGINPSGKVLKVITDQKQTDFLKEGWKVMSLTKTPNA